MQPYGICKLWSRNARIVFARRNVKMRRIWKSEYRKAHEIETGLKKHNNNTDKWLISLVCVSWTKSKVAKKVKKKLERFKYKAFYYLQSIESNRVTTSDKHGFCSFFVFAMVIWIEIYTYNSYICYSKMNADCEWDSKIKMN